MAAARSSPERPRRAFPLGARRLRERMPAARITIVCPNPALDRTMAVNRLRRGIEHRAQRAELRGGGKGVNVARALAAVGTPFRLVLPAGAPTGGSMLELLAAEGIGVTSVAISGSTRSTLTVLDDGAVTTFNDRGPTVSPAEWRDLLEATEASIVPGGQLVCSGSFPPELGASDAALVVTLARDRGCRVLVDSSAPILRATLGADIVFPNIHEAAEVLDRETGAPPIDATGTLEYAEELARELRAAGARAAVVTAGAAGAAVVDEDSVAHRIPGRRVRKLNPVGAGDCLVAGTAAYLAEARPLPDAVRWGAALAAASCERFAAADLDPTRAHALLKQSLEHEPDYERGNRRPGEAST